MSTDLLKNNPNASKLIVATCHKAFNNEDMEHNERSQIRVNFSRKFREKFNAERTARQEKPGRMATVALEWWLRQPKFVRDLAYTGQDFSERSEREVRRAVAIPQVSGSTLVSGAASVLGGSPEEEKPKPPRRKGAQGGPTEGSAVA